MNLSHNFPATLEQDHGLLLAGCLGTGVVLFAIGAMVGGARQKAGLKYPAMYFDNADALKDPEKNKFNCTQRGHQNLLESYTFQLLAFLVGGIKHPRINALLAVLWCVGAFSFARNYATGEPNARYNGLGGLIRLVLIASLLTGISTVLSVCKVL